MKFFLGAYDLFHIPVPIWIAVESVVGTVRLRCQMVSEAPFIRNVTFTLMGVPAVEAVRPSSPSSAHQTVTDSVLEPRSRQSR